MLGNTKCLCFFFVFNIIFCVENVLGKLSKSLSLIYQRCKTEHSIITCYSSKKIKIIILKFNGFIVHSGSSIKRFYFVNISLHSWTLKHQKSKLDAYYYYYCRS